MVRLVEYLRLAVPGSCALFTITLLPTRGQGLYMGNTSASFRTCLANIGLAMLL